MSDRSTRTYAGRRKQKLMMYARFQVLKSQLRRTDKGASMVEYALLVTLIALIALLAVQVFGTTLSGTYDEIAQELVQANS